MRAVTRLLVPTDFSDNAANAFQYALHLARTLECEVHVLHVVYPEYDVGMDVPVVAAQVTEEKIKVSRELIGTFIHRGVAAVFERETEAPTVEGQVVPGTPVETIARVAEEKDVDLIVMGTRGAHSRWEKWAGTVAAGVVRQAHCHVLVAPEGATFGPFETVACATDLTAADPWQIWKVPKLLQTYSPSLYCVHVRTGQNGQYHLGTEELQRFYQTHMPSIDIRLFDIQGATVWNALNDFSETHQVDLLVVFQPHRNLVERLFHQSATRRLAIHYRLPLLVLKEGK